MQYASIKLRFIVVYHTDERSAQIRCEIFTAGVWVGGGNCTISLVYGAPTCVTNLLNISLRVHKKNQNHCYRNVSWPQNASKNACAAWALRGPAGGYYIVRFGARRWEKEGNGESRGKDRKKWRKTAKEKGEGKERDAWPALLISNLWIPGDGHWVWLLFGARLDRPLCDCAMLYSVSQSSRLTDWGTLMSQRRSRWRKHLGPPGRGIRLAPPLPLHEQPTVLC